jgi:hypothetical protein
MLESDYIRNLNIKKTFQAIDKIKDYPIEVIRISLKYELHDNGLGFFTKNLYDLIVSEFISLVKKVFKKYEKHIDFLGASPEFRIDHVLGIPVFIFRFFIIGKAILDKLKLIEYESTQFNFYLDFDISIARLSVESRESLFNELYPNTMLDEVVNLMVRPEKYKDIPQDMIKIMMEPIYIDSVQSFIDLYEY